MSLDGDDSKVLEYLRSTNASRATSQVASATRIAPHETARVLLRLRDRGLIEKTASGWRAKGIVNSQSWTSTQQASGGRQPAPTGRAGSPRDGEPGVRDCGRENSEGKSVQERSIDPASRWADFRRLCLYYAECVRLEERASISAYAEKEGADFICLPGPIDWRAVSSGQKIRLIADPAWERFLRQGRTRGPCTTLYLGTPTDVFVGQDRNSGGVYRIISPVFVTSVVAKLGHGWLEIQPTDLVEINHGWLERRITRAQHRKEFLEQIGLAPTSLQDDEQEELWAVNGFEETTRLLFSCRQDWWKEYPDLQRLGTEPPFSGMDESGLRNRAVLMVQPELKYTKRLYGELRRLAFEVSDEDFDQTALVTLFPHKAPPKQPAENVDGVPCMVDAAEFCLLNDDQRTACVQALTEPLTVVTGPPGTGKSMVVAHALANSALMGRAALFASRNHQAIEAVEPRLNAMTEPETLVLRPTRPFGAQAAQFEWYRGMTTLLSRPRREGIEEEKAAADAAVQSGLARRRELESLVGLCARQHKLTYVSGLVMWSDPANRQITRASVRASTT